jgi:stress response protein YsnF
VPDHDDTAEGTDDWSVLSTERARVAFPVRVRGRVRLTKRVVTEEVTHTFTLRREVLEVEELPGDEPGTPPSWTDVVPDEVGEPFEVVLHAEQLVPTTVVVPVERVRVGVRVVSTDVLVTTELQTEQVRVEQQRTPINESRGTAAGGARGNKEELA